MALDLFLLTSKRHKLCFGVSRSNCGFILICFNARLSKLRGSRDWWRWRSDFYIYIIYIMMMTRYDSMICPWHAHDVTFRRATAFAKVKPCSELRRLLAQAEIRRDPWLHGKPKLQDAASISWISNPSTSSFQEVGLPTCVAASNKLVGVGTLRLANVVRSATCWFCTALYALPMPPWNQDVQGSRRPLGQQIAGCTQGQQASSCKLGTSWHCHRNLARS